MSVLIKEHFNKDKNHHAYLIEGLHDDVWPDLKKNFEELGIKTEANPDFFYLSFDTFKIDDAREVKSLSRDKSFSSEEKKWENKKIFIISASNFLEGAQNTLLKMFEEPNSNTHLFIITPDSNLILKTLLSRLYLIKYPKNVLNSKKEAENFIKMNIRERIDFIKESFSSKNEEEGEISNRTKASHFLNSLEETLHQKFFQKKEKGEIISFFDQIFIAREFLRQSGTSPKSLLEGVALTIPEF
jgi:hypothetical protein